ncbi:MAG: DUF5721 family protein [Eubacteriales bacterium]|jgi:hypothetical protein
MLALQIENLRGFMGKLLLRNTFDNFLVSDISVTTFASFHIDGQYHPEFYNTDDVTPEEAENIPDGDQICWKSVRPFVLQIMRGKRLPLSFHIVLQLSPDDVAELLEENNLNTDPESVYGLFLNMQYKNSALALTTGSSLKNFSDGHAIDQAWDRRVREFLAAEDIL